MVNCVETATEVNQREQADISPVHGPSHVVGNGYQSCCSAVLRAEAALVRAVQGVPSQVVVNLFEDNFLNYLADARYVGDGSKIFS